MCLGGAADLAVRLLGGWHASRMGSCVHSAAPAELPGLDEFCGLQLPLCFTWLKSGFPAGGPSHMPTAVWGVRQAWAAVPPKGRPRTLPTPLVQQHTPRPPCAGRILNAVWSGYAVGVAGVVAFLPASQCTRPTARRIGYSQKFKILEIDRARGSMVLQVCPPCLKLMSWLVESSCTRGCQLGGH